MKKMKLTASYALLALMLIGCGGGGSSSSEPEPGPSTGGSGGTPPASGEQFFFFQPGLQVFSEESQSIVKDLVGGHVNHIRPLYTGQYQSTQGVIKDIRLSQIVYEKAGLFWRLAADKGYNATPILISNETRGEQACSVDLYTDYADVLNSQLIYELPGIDNDCSARHDNVRRAIRLNMTANDAPIAAGDVIGAATAQDSGAIQGWYTLETQRHKFNDIETDVLSGLYYVNRDFTDKKTLKAFNFSSPIEAITAHLAPLGYSTGGELIIQVNNSLFAAKGENWREIYNAPGIIEVADLTNDQIFIIEFGATRTLKEIGLVNGNVRDLKEIGDINIHSLHNTDKHIVIESQTSGDENTAVSTLLGIHKLTGAQKTYATDVKNVYLVTPKYIYFESTAANTAKIISTDGAEQISRPNTLWAGIGYPTSIPVRGAIYPDHLIMAEGALNTQKQFIASRLWVYNALTQATTNTLGKLPADAQTPVFFGIGAKLIGSASFNGKRDLFSVDLAQPNSLLRITNTPDIDESF